MRRGLTSLFAVFALLVQGVLVDAHVHRGNGAPALAESHAAALASASAHDGGSSPLDPAVKSCVLCQASQAAGALLVGAAPALVEPIAHPARVEPPARTAPRLRRMLARAQPRGPPSASLSNI